MRRVVELLLDSGADVNEVHHNEYGAVMSVLYGAAGVVHDPEQLAAAQRGADPNDGEAVYHAVEAGTRHRLPGAPAPRRRDRS